MSAPAIDLSREAARARTRQGLSHHVGRAALYLLVAVLAVIFTAPFFFSISSSLKSTEELHTFPPTLVPAMPQFANYARVFQVVPYGTFYVNTVIIASVATLGNVLAAALSGYGFARFRWRGRDLIFYSMILLIFIPRAGGLMVQYELMQGLGLRNNLLGLILALSAGLAVPCFIMRQTFLNMPSEFEDAAQIDGCNRFQAFWFIMLPMATGAAVVVALFEFIRVWGEYLFTLTMIDNPELYTLGVGMAMTLLGVTLEFGEFTSYGAQAAAYVLAAAPVVVFFLLMQRWFVRGLMEGLKF
jgi:putative chitobiose transport system permease protein